MKKSLVVATASVLLVTGLILSGYALYRAQRSGAFDQRLQNALQGVQSLHTYEAQVETATALSDRTIAVSGLYRLDFDAKRYGSYATTTLTIPDETPSKRAHSFTFINLSIGDDIYVKIDTDSPLLQKSIPHSDDWRHFKANAVPAQFTDIAVSGPVLDNLSLLSDGGAYVSLSGLPDNLEYAGEQYHVYGFTLSKKTTAVVGGPLKSLIQRIGNGTVHVWIDDSPRIRFMTFTGENYRSTTTILGVNTPVDVFPPPEGK